MRRAHESAGKRTSGGNDEIADVHLKWAFGEAACIFMHESDQAKALSIIDQRLGRTVHTNLKRRTPWLDAHARQALFSGGSRERPSSSAVDSTG